MEISLPYNFTPRPYQTGILKALDSGYLNACWVVHRRGGKDCTMWNYIIRRAFQEPGTYYYLLPTYAQCKKVIWDGMTNTGLRMLDFIPKVLIDGNPNNTEMKVWIKCADGKSTSLLQLVGAESYEGIMGTNPRGIVFSEWSLMDPSAYDYIKPILAANKGWCAFLFTPRGRNHGWELYQIARRHPETWFCEVLTIRDTGVLSEEEIQLERTKGMPEDLIQQEFYCNFSRGQEGSYYGRQIDALRKSNQICRVPFDPAVSVNTYWDLGIGDSTAIWWAQFVGKEIHVISYYENCGEGLAHYIRQIDDFRKETGCTYGEHIAPHDIQARELITGKTRLESARRLGIKFKVAPKTSLEFGIEAVRSLLPRCWFDENACALGIKHLENYRKHFNEKMRVYGDSPLHDESSHGADAFRVLAVMQGLFESTDGIGDEEYLRMKKRWGWVV